MNGWDILSNINDQDLINPKALEPPRFSYKNPTIH
jgi:hypothetical protein